jgi:DNA mismatch endonuclease, patch repair protein
MADVVSPETRSRMMSGIRGKDTKPELVLRRGLHALGFRFRLHDSSLPGKPDLVLPRYKAVILVQGCFWHWHDCHLFKWPSTRPEWWAAKLKRNREKDAESISSLLDTGWRVLEVWECSLKGKTRLPAAEVIRKTAEWLRSSDVRASIRGNDLPSANG